jgi:5'-phosphate synthase pdxT subunit
MPGGESTSISNLLKTSGMKNEIIKRQNQGLPLWGTCAGLIIISKEVQEKSPEPLKLLDVSTSRNYYGRQIDSFIEYIDFDKYSYEGVFIRAPAIINIGKNVNVLAKSKNNIPVAVREGSILGTTFHPELTDDLRIHSYFLNMTKEVKK